MGNSCAGEVAVPITSPVWASIKLALIDELPMSYPNSIGWGIVACDNKQTGYKVIKNKKANKGSCSLLAV
jgi:hypothetical protein